MSAPYDPAELAGAVERDGIVGLPGAFPPAWADRLGEDFDALFVEARARPGGTVDRGPHRHYLAVPPERLRGFLELVSHPTLTALYARLLGPEWTVVETAFDVPLPDAEDQPWHRDFPMPVRTRSTGVLTSLVLNATAVDVTDAGGPLEIVPGSHREDGADFEEGMFPPAERAAGYAARAQRRRPRRGDLSVRTGLAVHRGTRNTAGTARPVLTVGVVAPEVDTAPAHDLVLTRDYAAGLPAGVRAHLRVTRVVDRLEPQVQRHKIEGLRLPG